ncbi:hypothetical protein [Kribbella sp. CA-293567]|uniref:hypothetical protein n=1 Tax=Kribbella sp. CA-293567 TaxID=3002436 RepID=UPI0022DD2E6D|nr:hypothetical protein [Kribbella sp. CA-293567]WBQ04937.1 hypothetical protein OX958_33915 [Kribbella sp. CA-293567]
MSKRNVVRVAVAGAVMAASALTMTTTASAGSNGCVFITFDGSGRPVTQHQSGCVTGTYHMDMFYPGVHDTDGPYTWRAGDVRRKTWERYPARGTKVCAQVWRHNSDGSFTSGGLPCETR